MNCPVCGAAVNGTFRFCSRCGAELHATARSPFVPYPQSPPAPYASPPESGSAAFGFAGWGSRVASLFLDGLIIGIPYVILTSIFDGRNSGSTTRNGHVSLLLYALLLLADGIYFTCLNGNPRGQTVGNRALGIAVRDLRTGAPIGLRRGFIRWFVRAGLYALLIIPGIVNDLLPLWDPLHQTIADKVAGTSMVRVKPPAGR